MLQIDRRSYYHPCCRALVHMTVPAGYAVQYMGTLHKATGCTSKIPPKVKILRLVSA